MKKKSYLRYKNTTVIDRIFHSHLRSIVFDTLYCVWNQIVSISGKFMNIYHILSRFFGRYNFFILVFVYVKIKPEVFFIVFRDNLQLSTKNKMQRRINPTKKCNFVAEIIGNSSIKESLLILHLV